MELIIVIIISVVVSTLNSFHVILQWINNKPGEVFTGIAHFYADYFLYTAQTAQGVGGRWLFTDHLFTNEPLAPTWYYWFNVTLGHVGSLVGLSPFATYNISLVLFVIALCLTWYMLAKTLYPTNRLLRLTTWMMILTATNWYRKGELLGQFWFSPAPVFNRLGGVPYQVFQTIVFLGLALMYSQILENTLINRNSRMRHYFFSAALSLVAAIANPVQASLFLAVMACVTVYVVYTCKSINAAVHRYIGQWVVVAFAGIIGTWMASGEFARQWVFVAARAWEQSQHVPNNLGVLLTSIGPIILFVPFGLRGLFKRGESLRLLITFWGLLSFITFLTPLPGMLQISPVRFLHPVPFASLAILGIEGLRALSGSSYKKRLLLVSLYLLFTTPSIYQQLVDRITPSRNPQLLMDTMYNHVPAPIAEALRWLKQEQVQSYSTRRVVFVHTSSSVVLTDPAIPIEVLVPVLAGKISFSGHPIHTLYPDVKEALRQEFFNGSMTPDQADRFLSAHRIGYIITAPTRVLPLTPTPVTEVYKNSSVTIYETSPSTTIVTGEVFFHTEVSCLRSIPHFAPSELRLGCPSLSSGRRQRLLPTASPPQAIGIQAKGHKL